MQIGCANHPRLDIFKEIKWIGSNRFDFIDLFMEPDKCEPCQLNPCKIKNALEFYNLNVVGHTPYYLQIGSPLKKLRDNAIEILKEYIDFFAAIECKKMTVHADWPNGMFSADEGVKFQSDTLLRLVEIANPAGIKILYEPVTTANDNKINISKILKANKDILFHADIGHLNLCGRRPLENLECFKSRLGHIHLHDNNGMMDLHLPIGAGNID